MKGIYRRFLPAAGQNVLPLRLKATRQASPNKLAIRHSQ
jgi:hypothetical protein